MADPWEEDWGTNTASVEEKNPWEQDWSAPKSKKVEDKPDEYDGPLSKAVNAARGFADSYLPDGGVDKLQLGLSDAMSTFAGDTYGRYGEDAATRTPLTSAGKLLEIGGGDIAPAIGEVAIEAIPESIKKGLSSAIAAIDENKSTHPIYAGSSIAEGGEQIIDALPEEVGTSLKQGANIAALALPKKPRLAPKSTAKLEKAIADRATKETQAVLEPYNIKKKGVPGDVEEVGLTNFQEYKPKDFEIRQYERTAEVPDWNPRRSARHNINAIDAEVGKMADQLHKDLYSLGEFDIKLADIDGDIARAISKVSENPILQGDAGDSALAIYAQYQKILKKYDAGGEITPQELLKSRKELDRLLDEFSSSDLFDPKTQSARTVAVKTIRQSINQRINDAVPNAKVKESLSHQSDLLTSRDHLFERDIGESRSGLGRALGQVEDVTGAAPPRSPLAFKANVLDMGSAALTGGITAVVLFGKSAIMQGKKLKNRFAKNVDDAISAGDSPALLAILNNEDNYED